MNWYLAKIIFQIICGEGTHTPQFDEQLRLIHAADETEAFQKAQHIGCAEEDAFENVQQQIVQWKFVNVTELYLLNGLIDGAELYSRIHEADDADHYIGNVHKKAAHIQCGYTHHLLQLL